MSSAPCLPCSPGNLENKRCKMCNSSSSNEVLPEEDLINISKSLISEHDSNTKCLDCNGVLICSVDGKMEYLLKMCQKLQNDPTFEISNDEEHVKGVAMYNAWMAKINQLDTLPR